MVTFEKPENYMHGAFVVKIQISDRDQARLNKSPMGFEVKEYRGVWKIADPYKMVGTLKESSKEHFQRGIFKDGIWTAD